MNVRNPDKIVLRAANQIDKLFNLIASDIQRAITKYGIRYTEPFWKSNRNLYTAINNALKDLKTGNIKIIKNSMKDAWSLSNSDIDKLMIDYIKGKNATSLLESEAFKSVGKAQLLGIDVPKEWVQYNETALNAMINRAENGITPSGRVWNISLKSRQMIEQTLKSGILDGTSSADMSRILRQCLKNPNALFRRVRNKETGLLELSKPAKNYHPGRGVYRSAYKNALRLTGTETNMAYRYAEFERMQQIPFIIGYEVNLSNNHPIYDICDSMKGKYPKTFTFIGWHPHCRCYTTSIMLDDEKFKKYLDTGRIKHQNYIKEIPKDAKNYLKDNEEKINALKDVPYWIRQNTELINSL
jgi:hypothetical protein